MSVNSKMTAIADKIRALLGISGEMGLDAMATHLGTEQNNVASAFAAIGNKGGTVPTSKVSGNLADAIRSIPESSEEVPSLQSKSAAPSETAQTIYPDTGYDGLSSVEVGAISSSYVGSSVTRKGAATYTPGTTDQTIAAGQYLSGAQTIKGDANLKAENIKSGVNIFGVTGTASGGIYPQRNAGTLTTNIDGYASVNVGFKPDIVLFKDFFVDQIYGEYQAAVIFPEKNDDRNLYTAAFSDIFFMGVHFTLRQTDNGFEVYIFTLDDTNTAHGVSNRQFPYVAVKAS